MVKEESWRCWCIREGKINRFGVLCVVGVNDTPPPKNPHLSAHFAGCNSSDLCEVLKMSCWRSASSSGCWTQICCSWTVTAVAPSQHSSDNVWGKLESPPLLPHGWQEYRLFRLMPWNSWNPQIQTMCTLQRGGALQDPTVFPERRRAATFCWASRFVRAPKSHTETGLVNPALTPGLCLLLREKGRRRERIKRFPPFPLLSINSFPLPSPVCCAYLDFLSQFHMEKPSRAFPIAGESPVISMFLSLSAVRLTETWLFFKKSVCWDFLGASLKQDRPRRRSQFTFVARGHSFQQFSRLFPQPAVYFSARSGRNTV